MGVMASMMLAKKVDDRLPARTDATTFDPRFLASRPAAPLLTLAFPRRARRTHDRCSRSSFTRARCPAPRIRVWMRSTQAREPGDATRRRRAGVGLGTVSE